MAPSIGGRGVASWEGDHKKYAFGRNDFRTLRREKKLGFQGGIERGIFFWAVFGGEK